MHMFKSFLEALPQERSDMVTEFDIDDHFLPKYVMEQDQDLSISFRSDSSSEISEDYQLKELTLRKGTASTDSSIPLSRAMTDSEIDYGLSRRLKSRNTVDPWDQMRITMEKFPSDYLDSLESFMTTSSSISEDMSYQRLQNEELRLRMEKFFEEECTVFSPDDPGLLELEEALSGLDLKSLDYDSDCGDLSVLNKQAFT